MAPTSSNDAATLSSSSSTQMKHPQNGPTPLPIRVLATVQSPGDDDQNATHDGSAEAGKNYYQVLHRLYSVSPLAPRDGQLLWNGIDRIDEDDGCRGEIETSLEQYVVPETASSSSSSSRTPNYTGTTHQKQHRVLWRRVVVRSGPSTDGRKVTHASYQLPEECNNATYNSSLLGSSSSSSSSLSPSVLCWTSFPDRPRHLMLCVLASPTLLCIWDVYPTQNVASDKKNDDGEGRQANKQQESLSGGESHMIPLPFEAEAIFAVEDSRGLLIQRAETPEDFVTWTTSSTHQPSLGSPASTTTPTANSIMMSQGDDDDNKKKQKGTDTDGGFVLKDPPKKAPPSSRPRESLGGHSFASSLNVSTTGTSVGAATSQTGDMQSIPSMFSLSHPYDDILPVSTFTDEGWHHSLASDVFEKIVFVGQATWMDDNSSGIPFMDRKVQTQNICVKYHTQYKTHSIWEIKDSPPPPPQAPLWKVSGSWRSKAAYDSHLGALEQGFDDIDLSSGRTRPTEHVPQVDTANRKQALADALGVARLTPRGSSSDNAAASVAKRTSRHMPSARRSTVNTSVNATMLSPLSRPGSTRSEAGSHFFGDIDSPRKVDQSMMTSTGPFSNLHPKLTLTCIYRESNPSPVSENIFLASNTSGSGKLSLCMVGVASSDSATASSNVNEKEIKIFSLTNEDRENQLGHPSDLEKLRGNLCVGQIHSMPCIAAQPIESSPTPKTFQPHRRHASANWQRNATDILLLHKVANMTDDGFLNLSLYRHTTHITDCAVKENTSSEIVYMNHAVGSTLDLFVSSPTKQGFKGSRLRATVSLSFGSCPVAERILQTLEAEMAARGLQDLALKIRADCVRLADWVSSSDHQSPSSYHTYFSIVEEVVLAVFFRALSVDLQTETMQKPRQMSSWDMLIQSRYHNACDEIAQLLPKCFENLGRRTFTPNFSRLVDVMGSLSLQQSKPLSPETASLMFDALHLLYEDSKLSPFYEEGLYALGSMLSTMCCVAPTTSDRAEMVKKSYLSHYSADGRKSLSSDDIGFGTSDLSTKEWNLSKNQFPPCILSCLEAAISGSSDSSYYSSVDVFQINAACTRTRSLLRIFNALSKRTGFSMDLKERQQSEFSVIKTMIEEGFESHLQVRDDLPTGVSIPLVEILRRFKMNAHLCDPADAAVLALVGREDMLGRTLQGSREFSRFDESGGASSSWINRRSQDEDDGVSEMERTSSMVFPEDNRVREVCRLLRTSKPVFLRVERPVELSDHDYERKKQEKLLLLSRRTLALPVGRGMFTIGNLKPVPAEPIPLSELCLSGRVPPTNATLILDTSECPVDMKVWPEFHNGVASGLRLPLIGDTKETVSKISRTWIVYNRPSNNDRQQDYSSNNNQSSEVTTKSLNHAHGGLLMALGMRGHLTALEMTDVFDYLTHGSVTTTVGVLLGMAANLRGTCDISVSKMLCLHIPSLIPHHFSTIDVASPVQAAAVAGAGLLYEGSSHRMMTEFLLNEIGKRPSVDGNVLDREAYSIACGISLGMVNLCKGGIDPSATGTAGLADLRIEERLYRYIVGGTDDSETRRRRDESDRLGLQSSSGSGNNEKCSCVYEGENINTVVTAPGSTLALGLIYMKSNNESVAAAIAVPDTHFLLEYVRPDFLMLRVISRALIMWDHVKPTHDWVGAQIPPVIMKAYIEMANLADLIESGQAVKEDHDRDYDRQAVRLIYVHVLAGACFALGLRYAGTGNKNAASVIIERLHELCDLRNGHDAVNAALRPPTPVLEMCLGTVAIALSMVLAGTGDLDALRMLKVLRWPCTEEISYGSHLAYSMAIGLLFLGGGKTTLGNEPSDIAALLMAFYPRFPSSTSDNQYHLQALRNLYALAVRDREVRAIDVDTGRCVPVPIELQFWDQKLHPIHKTTPFLLLNTDDRISHLRVVSDKYYDLHVPLDGSLDKKTLFVKRKGRYQDRDDPLSSRVLLDGVGMIDGGEALNFISRENKHVLAFGKHICNLGQTRSPHAASSPFSLPRFCRRALFQCLQHDSLEALPIYLALRNSIDLADANYRNCRLMFEWDLRLLRSHYERMCKDQEKEENLLPPLFNTEIVAYLMEAMEQKISTMDWNSEDTIESPFFRVSSTLRQIIDGDSSLDHAMDLS